MNEAAMAVTDITDAAAIRYFLFFPCIFELFGFAPGSTGAGFSLSVRSFWHKTKIIAPASRRYDPVSTCQREEKYAFLAIRSIALTCSALDALDGSLSY